VGKGVARISRKAMQAMGVREGDALEIASKRYTGAIAMQPYPEDEDLEIIRLDGLQRANAGSLGGRAYRDPARGAAHRHPRHPGAGAEEPPPVRAPARRCCALSWAGR